MGIKREADEAYFLSHPKERDAARALGEAFDIEFATHLRDIDVWNKGAAPDLSIWTAKPHAAAQERFGLYREVLVVYSRHTETDARILRTINAICAHEQFRDRVEPVLSIVVHEGRTSDVRFLDDPADRVVVTFKGEDLRNPKRGDFLIRSALAKKFGAVDLFGVSTPVDSETQFFGRSQLVEQLATKLYVKVENVGVFGLRKTGKTSILRALQRRQQPHGRLTVYLDCENPSLYRVRWWRFLRAAAQRIAESAGLGESTVTTLPFDELNASDSFAAIVRKAIKQGSYSGITVLLDEIEHITPNVAGLPAQHWDEDFVALWQTLRAIYHEASPTFSFVVAGVNPACVNETHFGPVPNPLFQLASPVFLEPLSQPAVREMVRSIGRYSGLDVREEVYPYLTKRFGGHAYLIRLACSEVWLTVNTTNPERRAVVTVKVFEEISTSIRARVGQPIKDILLSLVWWYPDEYDLLRVLADGDTEFVRDYLASETSAMLQFARYGLLDAETGAFHIEELREFLRQEGETYKQEVSPFRRSDIPSSMLPEVPDLGALGRLFAKKTELEVSLRRAIILYFGFDNLWDDRKVAAAILRQIPDRKEIFIGQRPRDAVQQLFLSDMKRIVVGAWELFGPLFGGDRRAVESNLDEVNVARRHDSHSKPVSDKEYRAFMRAYDWVLDCLKDVPA